MSFVAVSKVKYPVLVKDEIHDIGKRMIPVARQQPGFISVAFHQSADSNETMMYWEWELKSDHEACMKSNEWALIMAASQQLFQTEGIEFSLETYERIE